MTSPVATSRWVQWVFGTVFVLMTLNLIAAVARFQVEGLFWDQWVYCQPLFKDDWTWLDLFRQQLGPHRQGIAFVLTAPIMALADWDTRIEGLWIVFWLVVATGLALAWKRQLTGRLGWEDLWLPLALLSVRQFETIFVVPNLSHSVFPLVLLMGMAWIASAPMSLGRWLAFGALGGLAVFTGFGLFAGVAAGWIVAMRGLRAWWTRDFGGIGWPVAAGVLLVLALVAFLQDYNFRNGSAGSEFPHFPLSDYPVFVARLLASRMDVAGGGSGAMIAGGIVLALAVLLFGHVSWRIFRDKNVAPGWIVAALLLGTGLSFGFFTALGRMHLGFRAADAPRYVTLVGAVWLGFVAWSAVNQWRGWRWGAAFLGWTSVVMSWVDLPRRPLASWAGTLGMSEVSHNAIGFPNRQKLEWLLAWDETGDWRAAEARRPRGIFGEPESLGLGRHIDWLAERGLTFADPANEPLAWMPWWSPLGYTWMKGLGGEHQQWMAEEAIMIVEGRESGWLNLRFGWRAPTLPPEGRIEVLLGEYRAVVDAQTMFDGVSLPAPTERTKLVFRSTVGAVPLHPPMDPRHTSYLMKNPSFSVAPEHGVKWWADDGSGWWGEDFSEIETGPWNWEEEAGERFVWTNSPLQLRSRAREQTYWNIEIEGRYGPVDHGPILVRWDGQEHTLPWTEGGLSFSVPMRGGAEHRLEVINVAGARSPAMEGESGDARDLALRLRRLDFGREPVFELLGTTDEN